MKRFLMLLLLLLPVQAMSHSLSDSYLNLAVDEGDRSLSGHWLIAIRDLELAVGLDADGSEQITWGEVRQASSRITTHALSRLVVSSGGQSCALTAGELQLESLNAGMFLYIPLSADCQIADEVTVDYRLQFDIDDSHRGILTLTQGELSLLRLFSPDSAEQTVLLEATSAWEQFWVFVIEGIWHIWIGLDHILFLSALLIAVVLGCGLSARTAAVEHDSVHALGMNILKVVTAFTLAHSITLIMASLGWIELPSRLVESVIALSVALTGINLLYPLFRGHHWHIAFVFGLIHGFGFAGVLSDLSLPQGQFLSSLFGFNVGVEIGQLVIVALATPVLLILGRQAMLRRLTIGVGGVVIAGFGLVWFAERAFGI